MRLLIHTTSSPAHDLALEESIQLAVEQELSPNTWRLWQPAVPAVILGTGQEAAKEIALDAARAAEVPVLRRHSGGGTVVIGPGTINYSAFFAIADLPGAETIRGAMWAALKPVVQVLSGWGMTIVEAGLSDLAVSGADGTLRKIAGNSQARKKRSVVVHGTLLAAPDWERIARLLRFPSSVPDYRAGRDHRAFLTSLKDHGAPTEFSSFGEGLRSVLPSSIVVESTPRAHELEKVEALLKEKYGNPEWNFRR
jgi:lipoate---protein ligase